MTVLTASNTDVLAGTQLDQVPGPGTFLVIAASSVVDSTIGIILGTDTYVNDRPLPLRANGVPNASDDVQLVVTSPGGVRPVINIVEVTAMTVYIIVVFTPG